MLKHHGMALTVGKTGDTTSLRQTVVAHSAPVWQQPFSEAICLLGGVRFWRTGDGVQEIHARRRWGPQPVAAHSLAWIWRQANPWTAALYYDWTWDTFYQYQWVRSACDVTCTFCLQAHCSLLFLAVSHMKSTAVPNLPNVAHWEPTMDYAIACLNHRIIRSQVSLLLLYHYKP